MNYDEYDWITDNNAEWNTETPNGFSDEKGTYNYWQSAVNNFWYDTCLSTDEIELRVIVNYFNEKLMELKSEK